MKPSICSAVLMCHAPIVIPEIARGEASSVSNSTASMRQCANAIFDSKPDVVVVLSPHTPRFGDAFGVVSEDHLKGNFGAFGFSELQYEFASSKSLSNELIEASVEAGVSAAPLRSHKKIGFFDLDHGALVPLHFLNEAGWKGPTLVVAFPFESTSEEKRKFGSSLANLAHARGESWAILASGDMSHRLTEGAPAGFHPKARLFDDRVCKAVKVGDYEAAVLVDPELRELAAEDVIDSLEVAAAAVGFRSDGKQFFSYEGPFGVGYLNSVLFRKE